jgi:creatinine amidohydrolase
LDNATFATLIEAVVRSVLRHGFRRIVLVNAHGGNENALRAIVDDLTPKLDVPIIQFIYWHAAAVAIARILETQGGLQHACEAETAMMMAVRPDLVASDRISLTKANRTPDLSDVAGGGVYMWRSVGGRSASGVIGNPEAASPEKGEGCLMRSRPYWPTSYLTGPMGIAVGVRELSDRAELARPRVDPSIPAV